MSAILPFDASTSTVAVPLPSAFTYNLENATFTLIDNSNGPAMAQCSKTAKQIFGGYSTAQSAPSAIYFVSTTGSDSNTGTSSATPFLTLNKAQTAANTGGVPTKVYVTTGTYYRTATQSYPGSVSSTVDIAWVATGGRVIIGTFDNFSSPSKDATYTNTYSYARSSVDRVMDILNYDPFGHYNELQLVASAAICNITPGSWYTDGTTLYIQRADGAAVTATNTRGYLSASNFTHNGNCSFYMGSEDNGFSGFDTEGGLLSGLAAVYGTPNSTKRVIVAEYCTFRYAGGRVSTSGRGCATDSFYGWAWYFNCDASHNITDGFNNHNANAATATGHITINCTGFNNGAGPNIGQTSCNGWTSHENCMGADFGGRYERNHGGTCYSINTTVSLLAGTYVKDDQGDRATGGGYPPTAFQTANTAAYYLFRTKAEMQGGGYACNAFAGSTIYLRNVWPTRGVIGGGGTIGSW